MAQRRLASGLSTSSRIVEQMVKIRATFIATILFAFCVIGSWSQSSEHFFDADSRLDKSQLCDTLLRQAASNLEKQQWEYAVEKYGKVLEIDADNLAARYFRAYANTKLRHYDWAKSDYEDLLRIVPRHFESQLGLAYIYEKTGKNREAFDIYNRIVQQFPDSAMAYAARAVYEQNNNLAEVALYDWEQAIDRSPDNTDFMISRVSLLVSLSRREEAVAALNEMRRRGVPMGLLREWYKKCE